MRDDAAEQNLAKYRIGPLLGAGGMGEVYLAHDTSLNRDVAIKFIAADRLGDPDARRWLIREAQAAAALDHPSICTVHEVVDSVTRPFIVMQHVEGETLARRLDRGPLSPAEAVTLVAQVADALDEAHRRGVVHRDLKPQNIILTPSGRPKIVDFGIARLRPVTVQAGADDTRTAMTNPSVIIGTPAYMAPEQIQQRPADTRADLFSLGAVFYECLTGRRAFDGRSTLEVCGQVLHHQPEPPSRSQPGITSSHDDVCRRLLAKDPAARFQTAGEVVEALRRIEEGSGWRIEPSARRQWLVRLARSRAAQATLAIAVVLIAAAVWAGMRRGRLPPLPPEAQRSLARGTDFIRDGAYYSARLALEAVLRVAPEYTPAQARLAEALAGLDEEAEAQGVLLKIAGRRVGGDEQLRVDAVRALVLHDAPGAVRAYSRLAERRQRDARVWVDLGRAQEAAGQPDDARGSYQRALTLEPGYAAAHLRLASLDAEEGRRDEAIAGFDRAEKLYHTASDSEGETESLIRRGAFLDGIGEFASARAALEQAKALAGNTRNEYQRIRVDIRFSSVTASAGNLRESERLATQAVKAALDQELTPLAADGYIELGATLMNDPGRLGEAEKTLNRAIELAERRGADRVAARARLNLSSVHLSRVQPDRALAIAQETLPFLRAPRLRRLELAALGLIAEAHDRQGDYARARHAAGEVLRAAEQIRDSSSIVQALLTLGRAAAGLGLLPEALASAERVEELLRKGDTALLPFAMTTRAELLVRLGRGREAEPLLRQLEAAIAEKRETYVGRAKRVAVARALQATLDRRYADALRHADAALAAGPARDASGELAAALLAHSQSRLGRRVAVPPRSSVPAGPIALDALYWRALSLLPGAPNNALEAVGQVLHAHQTLVSPEAEWRLAAVGAAAASASGDTVRAAAWRTRAELALQRLRTVWKGDAPLYEARPDLQDVRRAAGLAPPPA